MGDERKHISVGIAAGTIGVLLLMLFVMLFIVYTGSYNVAASEDHRPFVRWMFTTNMHNAVSSGAAEITAPETFTDADVREGGSNYKSMCQHCHGGPGEKKSEWAKGMLPQPPHLPDVAAEWEVNEVFWLVKHGIKMTGMPSFGATHGDETLWNVAAFVKRLPGMTSETYAGFEASHSSGNEQQPGGQSH